MSRQIQIRRGTAAEHENFTGAIGEITMDTDNNAIRLHDGQTRGGHVIGGATLPDNIDYVVKTWRADDGMQWYRKYNSGWVEQGGLTGRTSNIPKVCEIILPLEMSDSNYSVNTTLFGMNETSGTDRTVRIVNTTTTSFSTVRTANGSVSQADFYWIVCGFAA